MFTFNVFKTVCSCGKASDPDTRKIFCTHPARVMSASECIHWEMWRFVDLFLFNIGGNHARLIDFKWLASFQRSRQSDTTKSETYLRSESIWYQYHARYSIAGSNGLYISLSPFKSLTQIAGMALRVRLWPVCGSFWLKRRCWLKRRSDFLSLMKLNQVGPKGLTEERCSVMVLTLWQCKCANYLYVFVPKKGRRTFCLFLNFNS